MKISEIRDYAKRHKEESITEDKKYSVLIPIIEVDGEIHLLYEVRSKSLRNQPGEIAFPGGKMEKGEDFLETAKRETCEELLLKDDEVEIFGKGDFLINPNIAILYSAIGEIKKDFKKITPNKDEVEKIFTIPLDYFLKNDPEIYRLEVNLEEIDRFPYELIPNGRNYKFKRGIEKMCFYIYEDKIIWGLTAKMTYNFIEKLKKDYVFNK